MGMTKRYFNDLICACASEAFAQDAIEHTLITGQHPALAGKSVQADAGALMADYDGIIERYRKHQAEHAAQTLQLFHAATRLPN